MAAIYQRARPLRFDQVVGQEHVKEVLVAALRTGRIGHAYLFSGPRGVGKTTTARLLAMALDCEHEAVEARPCGRCDTCRAIRENRHPDVMELDAASNNSVDDVRELRDKVRLASVHGGTRVWILDEAHMLSKAAANALLKTLEEPPQGLVFVLATTEPEKLPATVLSRCQHFRFRRLSDDEIRGKLARLCEEADVAADDDALQLVARAAEGGMRDAESLLERLLTGGERITRQAAEGALGLPPRSRLEAMAAAIAAGALGEAWGTAEGLYRDGFAPRSLAEQLVLVLRDALFEEVTGGEGFRLELPRDGQLRVLHALDEELDRFVRRDDLYSLEAALLKAHVAAHGAGAEPPAAAAGDAIPAGRAAAAAQPPADAPGEPASGGAVPPRPVEPSGPPERSGSAPAPEGAREDAPARDVAPAAEPAASQDAAPASGAPPTGDGLPWHGLRAQASAQLKAFLQPAEHEVGEGRLVLRYGERHRFHFQQISQRRKELEALIEEVGGPGWTLELLGPEEGAPKKA